VSRLEVVDLNFTKLREEQLTELLHKIKGNSQLKDLTLSSNDFLQVDPKLLGKVVGERLERANLSDINFNSHQAAVFMNSLPSLMKLKFLDFRKNKCNEEIPQSILKKTKILT